MARGGLLAGVAFLAFAGVIALGGALHPLPPEDPRAASEAIGASASWRLAHGLVLLAAVFGAAGFLGLPGRVPRGEPRDRAWWAVVAALLGFLLLAAAMFVELGPVTSLAGQVAQGGVEAEPAFAEAFDTGLNLFDAGTIALAVGARLAARTLRAAGRLGPWNERVALAAVGAALVGGVAAALLPSPEALLAATPGFALVVLWATLTGWELLHAPAPSGPREPRPVGGAS